MSAPQRLTVRHQSVYHYSEPVRFGEHRMMFRPRASHDLRLLTTQLHITPTPERLHLLHDVFDNSVAVATFSVEASGLLFRSEVTLERYEAPLPDYSLEAYVSHHLGWRRDPRMAADLSSGAGWVHFDPTNSIDGNRHLISVAVAWNYDQALPLWGTWHGAMHSFCSLEVDVSMTEDA